jgi:hypothetical protein
MERAVIKFNGGNLAMLCSYCHRIIKTGRHFTTEEIESVLDNSKHIIPAQYCESCKEDGYDRKPSEQ